MSTSVFGAHNLDVLSPSSPCTFSEFIIGVFSDEIRQCFQISICVPGATADSFNPGDVGVTGYHVPLDPAQDRLLPPSCLEAESGSAQTCLAVRSHDPTGQVIRSAEVNQCARSPPHRSGVIGPSGNLQQPVSLLNLVPEVIASPSPTVHGLKFPSLEDRLRPSQTSNPVSLWSNGTSMKNDNTPCAGENDRVSISHTVPNTLVADTVPTPDYTSGTKNVSPSPLRETGSHHLSPAREPADQASDSGTASGYEYDPDDPSDLSAPRLQQSHWPTSPDCGPEKSAVSETPEGTTATTSASAPASSSTGTEAAAATRLRLAEQQHGADPWPEEPPSGGGDPDRLPPPREPTEPEEREPAPGLLDPAGAEPEEAKDPGLAELGITAELCSRDLWLEFHEHGTEMIITKMGR